MGTSAGAFRIHLHGTIVDFNGDFPDMLAALRQRFLQRIGITGGCGLRVTASTAPVSRFGSLFEECGPLPRGV